MRWGWGSQKLWVFGKNDRQNVGREGLIINITLQRGKREGKTML